MPTEDELKAPYKVVESEILATAMNKALEMIAEYGSFDGGHHKQWVLDQVARILCGTQQGYLEWRKQFIEDDVDGQYDHWEEGIAP